MNDQTLTRRIVCAACCHGNILLVAPRHWDMTMRAQFDTQRNKAMPHEFEEGFINTWGEFLSRKDAWIVACYNDQIKKFVGSQDYTDFAKYGAELFSENLY